MNTRRRDHKNRVLRPRESQQLDGRYRYTYYSNGKQKSLYSWKLEPTDKMPVGKRPDLSLREKVAELQRQEMLFGNYVSGDYTVIDLVERYVAQKQGVRLSTKEGYQTIINVLKRDSFGKRKIKDIRVSDAKLWFVQLQNNGRGYSSIHNIRGVLRPAYQMAVDDDLLLKNPFDFKIQDVVKNDSQKRISVTQEQQEQFLKFIQTDKHYNKYYDAVYILFHTGLRISEFCGLALSDIDMKERTIHVNHQLRRLSDMQYVITETKTDSGARVLPMTQEVYECFQRILKSRKRPRVEPMVDKRIGFLFLDKNGMPKVAGHWEKYFNHMVGKYNRMHKVQLPAITPHVCRHTYCTNMARAGMNPKSLQYLMGHAEVATTMDVYTHFGYEEAKKEVEKVGEIMNVSYIAHII